MLSSETFSRRYFVGEDPIGRRLKAPGWKTIVGVIGAVRHNGPGWRNDGDPMMYVPHEQEPSRGMTLWCARRAIRKSTRRSPEASSGRWIPGCRCRCHAARQTPGARHRQPSSRIDTGQLSPFLKRRGADFAAKINHDIKAAQSSAQSQSFQSQT